MHPQYDGGHNKLPAEVQAEAKADLEDIIRILQDARVEEWHLIPSGTFQQIHKMEPVPLPNLHSKITILASIWNRNPFQRVVNRVNLSRVGKV
jgi:hypothetical protein